MQDARIFGLFSLYVAAGLVLNIIFEVGVKSERTGAFLWFWSCLGLLAAASMFGSVVYGDVKRSIGGAEPMSIKLIVMDDAPKALKEVLGVTADVTGPLFLLGETTSEFLISPPNQRQALRIKRDLVAGVISVTAENRGEP